MSQSFAPFQSDDFKRLWAAQDGVCAVCGTGMPATRFDVAHATLWKKWRPTMDHIRASANGGGDGLANLQLAHALCNKRKGRS